MSASRVFRSAFVAVFGLLLILSIAPLQGREIDSSGQYRGFFQSTANAGQWGAMEFVIDSVRNHRFGGNVVMIIGPSDIRVPFAVDGTVSESGEFTGNGKGPGGMVVFHGQITFLDGGAAIADANYLFRNPGPTQSGDRGTATLLRDFAIGRFDPPAPIVNGQWTGLASSNVDGSQSNFILDVTQSCAETKGNLPGPSFVGTEVIGPGTDHPLRFYFRGSVNGDGRFAVIGWDLSNDRFVVTGGYSAPPEPDQPATAVADYTLYFGNGFTDRGTFSMGQQLVPPDPCKIKG